MKTMKNLLLILLTAISLNCFSQGTCTYTVTCPSGSGTVTSVGVSGGSTGLTFTNTPITTSGTATMQGVLNIASGGTGTSSPSLTAGSNVTLNGSWPTYTINATGGGGVTPPLTLDYNGVGLNFDFPTGGYFATNYKKAGANIWQLGVDNSKTLYLYNYAKNFNTFTMTENGEFLFKTSSASTNPTWMLEGTKDGILGNHITNNSTGAEAQAYFRATNNTGSLMQMAVMGSNAQLWPPIFSKNAGYLEHEYAGAMNIVQDSPENMNFFTNCEIQNFDSSAHVMSLTSTQRVGIGTWFPSEKLTVKGRIRSSTSDIVVEANTRGLILKDTQSTPHYWRISISNTGVLTTTDLGTTLPAE